MHGDNFQVTQLLVECSDKEEHHDYDVNPSDFVIFLFDKGIDILTFTDKNYLHDMWVEFHGGDNPCGRDCCLYGSLCLQIHCDSYFM